jgi:drug/metabolite transporter (DMT)-like permease
MNDLKRAQLFAVAELLFATVAWGAAFVFVKMTVMRMNLYCFLFLRFSLATLLMFLIFPRRVLAADGATVRAAFWLSLLLGSAYFAQTEGLRFTAAANSALITCLYIVLIPAFCIAFQRARPEAHSIVGAAVAFFGMYLLTSCGLAGMNAGDLMTLVCAIAFAWHFILTGRYSRRHGLVPLVTYQLMFTAAMSGIVALAQGGFSASVPPVGILTILFTAIFATVIAFLIQTHAQRVLSPARTGVICSMEAVFGALIPWATGFERPTVAAAAGACVMIAGMLISELGVLWRPSSGRASEIGQGSLVP